MNQAAEKALQYFHSQMLSDYGDAYTYTFPELLDYINGLNPWFEDTFGKALAAATSLSADDIKRSMNKVADLSQGALPAEPRNLSVFYDALLDNYDMSNLSTWTRLGKEVAVATVQDVKTAAVIGLGGAALYGLVAVAVAVFVLVGRRR